MGTVNDYSKDRLQFAYVSQHDAPLEVADKDFYLKYGVHLNRECVQIGKGTTFLTGSVVGFKGFSWGFTENQTPVEITHKGGVIIGRNVEVGANCTIARATLPSAYTKIGDYVKIDSHVHIAHNCVIGDRCIITACAMVAGGVIVGERSWLGPNCSIMNGVTIGKNNVIGIGATIRSNTKDNAIMYGDNLFMRFRND